jgi:hypothetical protein
VYQEVADVGQLTKLGLYEKVVDRKSAPKPPRWREAFKKIYLFHISIQGNHSTRLISNLLSSNGNQQQDAFIISPVELLSSN